MIYVEAKEKAISLFKYIKELYAQRHQIISDIRNQPWHRFIKEIPKHDNIIVNYMDRTDEDIIDDNEQEVVLLQIQKPEFESCPQLPSTLENWIEGDWHRYNSLVKPKDKLVETKHGEALETSFADDKTRVRDYTEWNVKRNEWVRRQIKIAEVRNLFNELYRWYIDLDRDSESLEIMVGQGILECKLPNSSNTYHPILLKRVSMTFDSKNNILSIIDSDMNSEIYTMLLQHIDYINHSSVKSLTEELADKFYHPLDRNDTPDYLKGFAHKLHSDSKFITNSNEEPSFLDKVIIYDDPVFFIRKRISGVIKAIDDIIIQIDETGVVSGPLNDLIGVSHRIKEDKIEQLDLSEKLAAISGEDKDILLTKEANKEQLQIAKRIENYNAVLVQGPPGTGKTHTIANLIGHFLAQGKNILVTSHTRKALSVVKEKVVTQLQNLCVAVLDDDNRDMERSVDGITEYISTHTSMELAENIEKLKCKRIKILEDLAKVRKDIYAIKLKEYESIIFGGKGYSVAEAASFVFNNKDELSYLPGKVILYKPLPVSIGELELVYKTNELISIEEESELSYNLPNPIDLLSPNEFQVLVKEKSTLIEKLRHYKDALGSNIIIDTENITATIKNEPLCNNFDYSKIKTLKNMITSHTTENFKDWQLDAILAGKKGGGFRIVWENLISLINKAYNFSSEIAPRIIGKNLTTQIMITNHTIDILNEIREHLSSGRKLSSFTLFRHKEWKDLLSSVKINNQDISSVDDCEIAILIAELELKRRQIAELWIELIEKRGGIAFTEFGEAPEQSCISFVEQIEECLNWYHDKFETIKEMANTSGFSSLVLENDIQYTNPIEEINYLIKLIYGKLPQFISLSEIIYYELPKIRDNINRSLKVLEAEGLNDSKVCKDIVYALKEDNIEDYRKHYNALDSLYTKYYYQSERRRILNEIAKYAPEWSNLIKNRVGIHGQSNLPENIEDAWKWKQFAGIIDEITSQPFEELQRKSVYLSKELRRATADLAENCAWYHLLTRIESDISKKQALQGWKLTTKKIGKGTGKSAPKLKREAQKLMAKCQRAVPAWIMPVNKALESLDPVENKFDIVIIDEASQSDISALAIMYMAKKIIIVGDDEQVSPSAVGVDLDKMTNLADMYIKDIIPNSHLYDMKSSLYDIAKTTFPTLMLKEHFRCVPSIIGYSNRLSYDYKIKPLRDDSNVIVKPATIAYRVDGQRDRRKRNITEAKWIVALMMACMEQPEYDKMTFGAISLLGDEQARTINQLAIEKIEPQVYEKRRILCGNASHFQGDERDVIFISLVDSNEGEGPLRLTGEGVGKSTKQRYNVAVSRAKDQLWVVHSLDINNDLKSGDMRKGLIEYATNPLAFREQREKIEAKADSPFEISVAGALVKHGYNIEQQWKVGSYSIDMVAKCGDNKIAIECDGELYHSGYEKIREDMERQAILERLGWRFIRIRGSEYYRNPSETIKRVISELNAYEIYPEQNIKIINSSETELQQRVIARAAHIIDEWDKHENIMDLRSGMN